MSEWISVEDRLPEDRVDVVFYGEFVGTVLGNYACERDGPWHAVYSNFVWNKEITHWMPLPPNPSIEE